MTSSDEFIELDHNICFDEDDNFQLESFALDWEQACDEASETSAIPLWTDGPKRTKAPVQITCEAKSEVAVHHSKSAQSSLVEEFSSCSMASEQDVPLTAHTHTSMTLK